MEGDPPLHSQLKCQIKLQVRTTVVWKAEVKIISAELKGWERAKTELEMTTDLKNEIVKC